MMYGSEVNRREERILNAMESNRLDGESRYFYFQCGSLCRDKEIAWDMSREVAIFRIQDQKLALAIGPRKTNKPP